MTTSSHTKPSIPANLFIGTFSTGIFYADKNRTAHGDYARCGAVYFSDLRIEVEPDCPNNLRQIITEHAKSIQARAGQQYQISSSGQAVTLGYGLQPKAD